MYSEIYIDVVFLMNFLMDYLLLRLVGQLCFRRKNRIRCILAALFGAFVSCLLLLIPGMGGWAVILLHALCGLAMLWICWGFQKSGLMFRAVLTLYLAAFLFGGFWEAMAEERANRIEGFLLASAGMYLQLCAASALYRYIKGRIRNIYPVTIAYGDRKSEACGFYDTGNLLQDPISGKPVSVLSANWSQRVLGRETLEKLKYIIENPGELENTELSHLKPHFLLVRTVSQKDEMMLAVTLDKLCIHTPKEVVCISSPVFVLLFESSALGKEYEVLINSRLLQ